MATSGERKTWTPADKDFQRQQQQQNKTEFKSGVGEMRQKAEGGGKTGVSTSQKNRNKKVLQGLLL